MPYRTKNTIPFYNYCKNNKTNKMFKKMKIYKVNKKFHPFRLMAKKRQNIQKCKKRSQKPPKFRKIRSLFKKI